MICSYAIANLIDFFSDLSAVLQAIVTLLLLIFTFLTLHLHAVYLPRLNRHDGVLSLNSWLFFVKRILKRARAINLA
jgi:hypothetical protein